MVEGDLAALVGGFEAGEELRRSAPSIASRVQRTAAAAAGEKVEMSSCVEHGEVVVADQADARSARATRAAHSFGWAP